MIPERFAPVLDELAPLAARFGSAGHRLYLVGGAVRDLLVGTDRPRFDLDLTTDARPAEIKRLVDGWADAVWTQGERFGTIGVRHERADGSVQTVEITTFRAEAYADDSRKPHVTFADDIETDLSRRDFTVNAMALELRPGEGRSTPGAELVDPFGGVADLAGGDVADAARARGQLRRRPVAHAARSPVHRRVRPDAGARVRHRGARTRPATRDRVGRARPRRARQADRARSSVGGAVVPGRHRPGRALPARAPGVAARARSDPSPQGRPQPHDRGGRERPPAHPTGRRTTFASPAWPRCSTTWASRAPVATRPARGRRSTITTSSGRG